MFFEWIEIISKKKRIFLHVPNFAMFSGIIQHRSKILSLKDSIFVVENPFDTLSLGQSIAHD